LELCTNLDILLSSLCYIRNVPLFYNIRPLVLLFLSVIRISNFCLFLPLSFFTIVNTKLYMYQYFVPWFFGIFIYVILFFSSYSFLVLSISIARHYLLIHISNYTFLVPIICIFIRYLCSPFLYVILFYVIHIYLPHQLDIYILYVI